MNKHTPGPWKIGAMSPGEARCIKCGEWKKSEQPLPRAFFEKGKLKLLKPTECRMDSFPIYTEPPKREWIGLTDEDDERCKNEAAVKYRMHKSSIRGQMITPADNYEWHLIRTTEAKLKELNA